MIYVVETNHARAAMKPGSVSSFTMMFMMRTIRSLWNCTLLNIMGSQDGSNVRNLRCALGMCFIHFFFLSNKSILLRLPRHANHTVVDSNITID